MSVNLKDEDFVDTGRAICRVFGAHHPNDGVLLLARYLKVASGWTKPDVYSSETLDAGVSAKYDVPTAVIGQYGMRLGVGWMELNEYVTHFDALGPSTELVIGDLRSESGLTIGLGGSRLVGLSHAASDLDLILYGGAGLEAGPELFVQLQRSTVAAPRMPVLDRFGALAKPTDGEMRRRNIYHAMTLWRGVPTKVDIHYTEFDGGGLDHLLQPVPVITESILLEVVVEDASRRHLFPGGSLSCRDGSSRVVEVGILDHVLSFCLPGDRVTLKALPIQTVTGDEYVGAQVLAIRTAK